MLYRRMVDEKFWSRAFQLFYGAFIFVRWLFGRPLGLLVLSLGGYFWMVAYCSVKPMNFSEFMVWLSEQPNDVKSALATAVITVVGFLVAFQAANSSWRMQRRTEIRLAAAEEIYNFFNEATDLILKIEVFSEFLVEVESRTHDSEGGAEKDHLDGLSILKRLPEILSARDRLSRMSVDVHSLRGKHYSVLTEQIFAVYLFERAQRGLADAATGMWFGLPVGAPSEIGAVNIIRNRVDARRKAFSKQGELSRDSIAAASGAIRALFVGDVVKPSFSGLLNVRSVLRELNSKAE